MIRYYLAVLLATNWMNLLVLTLLLVINIWLACGAPLDILEGMLEVILFIFLYPASVVYEITRSG